jgi:hypothetical protein
MIPSAGTDVLWQTDQVKEHCGNASVDPVLQELCSNEQTAPPNPVGPSDEGAFETFLGGAGI